MSRTIGDEIPDRITITIDPLNKRDVAESIKNKEFTSVVNLINTALRFYFDNRDKPEKIDEIKVWLVSEEGEDYIKKLIRKVREKE